MTAERLSLKRLSILAGALLALSGCQPSKYVLYKSPFQDYTCEVPWGWQVFLDAAGSDYTNVTFTGPLDPEFYRGVPSLSVRWYALKAPHRLVDGSYESYASADDFTRQMLAQVYAPDGYTKAGSDYDQQLAASKNELLPDIGRVKVSGWEASYYVVYRTIPAPDGKLLGVVANKEGKNVVRQRHAYAVLPMNGGFYVIVYPSTREGFEKYKPALFKLLNSFKTLKDGPAGAVIPQF